MDKKDKKRFNLITFNIHSDATLLAKMAKFVSKKKRTIVAIQEIPADSVINSISELNFINYYSNPNGNLAFMIPKSLSVNIANIQKKKYPSGFESRTLEIKLPLSATDDVCIVNVHGYSFSNMSRTNNRDLFHDINKKYASYEKVILLGDFNTNPYDENMVRSEALLSYRDFIDVLNAQKNVFYNPSWRYLRERKYFKGSFYYFDGIPKWNMYDQILISKKLVGKISGSATNRTYTSYIKLFHIPDRLGKIRFVPSKSYDGEKHISDHMPVLLTVEM